MGSNFPPDNWIVSSGVWGTDIDREETVKLSGPYSVVFNPTTPASDPEIQTKPVGINGDPAFVSAARLLRAEALIRADRNSAGDNIFIDVELLDGSLSVVGFTTLWSGPVTTINTWERKSRMVSLVGTTSRFARFVISKANVNFTAYIDSVRLVELPYWHTAQMDPGPQSIPDSAWTTVLFDRVGLPPGFPRGISYNTGTGVATFATENFYSVYASAKFLALLDGQFIGCRLLKNSVALAEGDTYFVGGAGKNSAGIAFMDRFQDGDTLEVQVFQSGAAAAKSLAATSAETWFRILEGKP